MIRGWAEGRRRTGLLSHLADPLYRTGYLLTLGTTVTSGLGFVFWLLVAHGYAPAVVGANAAAISAMMFLANVCQLGLPAALVRDLPSAGDRAGGLIVRSYGLSFGVALALGLGAALTSHMWSKNLGFLGRETGWLVGFPLATAFFTIFQAQDWVMTGLEGAHWVPIENSLFSLAKLALLVAIVTLAPFAGPFIAWSVPAALAALLITALIFRRLIPAVRRRPDRREFDVRRFVGLAAANQVALLFTYAVTLLMPVVVATETSTTTSAYFYVPWTIAVAVQVFAVNTSTSLTVEAALDRGQLAKLTRRTLLHTTRVIAPVALAVLIAAPYGLRLFGGGYATHGASLLRLLAVASLPNAVYTVGETLLRIQHRLLSLILTQGGQAVLFLGLSLWLLPRRGLAGVGIAFLTSQLVMAGVLLITTLRPLLIGTARGAEGA